MNSRKQYKMNEDLKNRIISVAYGDAAFWEKLRIKILAKNNVEVKSLLDDYSAAAKKLKSADKFKMPEELTENVEKKLGIANKPKVSFLQDFFLLFLRKPIYYSAALVLIIGALMSTMFINRDGMNYKNYSEAEVQLASMQSKKALKLVGSIFKRTQYSIQKDVLEEGVTKPIGESFNKINKLLNRGGQNEITN